MLGLGDVYLGCAIATAIDPRYNFETTSSILFNTSIMCESSLSSLQMLSSELLWRTS